MTKDLIAFLRARFDEDEAWARGASRVYPYADEGSAPPDGGVHWTWVVGENWDPVKPDPALNEFVAEPGDSCNLVTVEEWPSRGRPMPMFYANSIVEMDASAAGHIVRHDPARVLADVAAKRRILAELEGPFGLDLEALNAVVRHLATAYADHPDYRDW